MTKIATGFALTLIITAAALQSIASAEEKKNVPAVKPAPAARPAPVARPAAPVSRPAATLRQQRAPTARQAPVIQRAPATVATPSTPARVVGPRNANPTVAPSATAPNTRATTGIGVMAGPARAASIRGAGRATIAGQNFTIWRGSHRAYHDGRWRTFVGLSTLGAILVGSAYYYPYAYIDAPYDYCQGWTEDGCELRWEAVSTVDGSTDFQCVAYCPWQ